jgi:hypothetical protein
MFAFAKLSDYSHDKIKAKLPAGFSTTKLPYTILKIHILRQFLKNSIQKSITHCE